LVMQADRVSSAQNIGGNPSKVNRPEFRRLLAPTPNKPNCRDVTDPVYSTRTIA